MEKQRQEELEHANVVRHLHGVVKDGRRVEDERADRVHDARGELRQLRGRHGLLDERRRADVHRGHAICADEDTRMTTRGDARVSARAAVAQWPP